MLHWRVDPGSYVGCSLDKTRSQTLDRRESPKVDAEGGQCEQEDFLEGRPDSNVFSLSEAKVTELGHDSSGIALAASLVNAIAKNKGCTGSNTSKFHIDLVTSRCAALVPSLELESEACFVNTNLGHFFVIQDALGGANLVFNRLD